MIFAKIHDNGVATRNGAWDGFDLAAAQAEGFQPFDVPSADWLQLVDGAIVVIDPTPALLARLDKEFSDQIDNESSRVLEKYTAPGKFRTAEYERTEKMAQKFKDAGYPLGAVPKAVQAWLDHNTIGLTTAQAAADHILAEATFMNDKLDTAREKRLRWKKQVLAATTEALKRSEFAAAMADLALL